MEKKSNSVFPFCICSAVTPWYCGMIPNLHADSNRRIRIRDQRDGDEILFRIWMTQTKAVAVYSFHNTLGLTPIDCCESVPNIKSITQGIWIIVNLANSWRHLQWFQIWSPCGATCIKYKLSQAVAPLALPHCLWLTSSVIWYLHRPESHQLNLIKVFDGHPDAWIRPKVYLGLIKR